MGFFMKKLILIMLFSGNSVFASTNDVEAIDKAKLSIASYNCYAFYSYLNKDKEAQEMFRLGYKSSIDFISYTKTNRINEKLAYKNVPSIYLMTSGPNADFIAGQVFASVAQTAIDKIFKDSKLDFVYEEELRKMKAQSLIRESNCELLK